MILNNELQKRFQQRSTLLRFEPIDLLRVDADGIDRLPARDGIGADDGVDGREVGADVLGGAAGAFEEGEAAFRCDGVELGLGEGAGEGLVELLVGFRDAVVDVVAGGPEGVWDGTCQLVFAKGGGEKRENKGVPDLLLSPGAWTFSARRNRRALFQT